MTGEDGFLGLDPGKPDGGTKRARGEEFRPPSGSFAQALRAISLRRAGKKFGPPLALSRKRSEPSPPAGGFAARGRIAAPLWLFRASAQSHLPRRRLRRA